MLLYDDVDNAVLNSVSRGDVLYDFELQLGSGTVKGTFINNAAEVAAEF